MRNQALDFELLKLPSIGHEEGITFLQTKPMNLTSNTTSKANNQGMQPELKNDVKLQFNALLNKTRIDNLPPLQELSVFEQSFEGRRKQIPNQPLRSRSKNYRNFETGSYINGSQNDKNPKTAKLTNEESFLHEKSVDSKHHTKYAKNKLVKNCSGECGNYHSTKSSPTDEGARTLAREFHLTQGTFKYNHESKENGMGPKTAKKVMNANNKVDNSISVASSMATSK